MKTCSKCKEKKSLAEFHNDRSRKDGKCHYCKSCIRSRDQERKNNDGYKKFLKKHYRKKHKTPGGRLRTYRRGAKKRSYDFQLTKGEFMTFWNHPCHYCGEEIDGIGLDRIDNSKGYILKNVVPCCSECNRMKGINTSTEFIERCKKIVDKKLSLK